LYFKAILELKLLKNNFMPTIWLEWKCGHILITICVWNLLWHLEYFSWQRT